MKNDLTCIEEALLGERAFLAKLEKGCTTNKTAEWEEIVKTRAAETIKVLNNDDALELFKRPCQVPPASFRLELIQQHSRSMPWHPCSEIKRKTSGWTLLRWHYAEGRLDLKKSSR